MKNKKLSVAIVLIIISSFLITLAQLFFKAGSYGVLLYRPLTYLANVQILLGVFFYFLSFLLGLMAYRFGELTLIYPLTSLCYVWNMVLAIMFLGEVLTPGRLIGTGFIVGGSLLLVGRPS